MLKKVGIYNDFDPSLLPELPPVGTVVSYQFNYTYRDPIPKASSGMIRETYQHMVQLPTLSWFWDSIKGRFVQIGLVDSVDAMTGKIEKAQHVYARPQENLGKFELTIGSPSDNRLYQFLEMCSYVKHMDEDFVYNPDEDIIMTRVDNDRQAKIDLQKRRTRKDATDRVDMMSYEEMGRVAYIVGINAQQEESTLRNALWTMAEQSPEGFLRQITDEDGDNKSTINQAIVLDVVYVDESTSNLRMRNTNGVIMPLDGVSDVPNQFAGFMRNPANKNAEALLKAIKSLIADAASKNPNKKVGRPKATA